MPHKLKLASLLILVLFIVILLTLGVTEVAQAIVPFGGRIITMQACTKPPGFLITVGPPRGGAFIYYAGITRLFRNYAFKPSSLVLGAAATASTPCIVGVCPACSVAGAGLLITMMGTAQ